MRDLPTYENDKRILKFVIKEPDELEVLKFFSFWGYPVNVANLTYCVSQYGKRDISKELAVLASKGLIKLSGTPAGRITWTGRWHLLKNSKTVLLILAVVSIAVTVVCSL